MRTLRPLRLFAPLLVLLLSTACIFGPDDTNPEPTRCNADDAAAWTPDAIDILPSAYDARPLADGDTIPLQWGGQGAQMYGIAVELHGADVPDCLAMQVAYSTGMVEDGPLTLSHESGRHFTDNLMDVMTYEGDLDVTVTVGDLSKTVHLIVTP